MNSRILKSTVVAGMLAMSGARVAAAAEWCPPDYSCYYDGYDLTYKIWTAPSAGCHYPLPRGVSNRISSVWNRGHGTVYTLRHAPD